MKIILEFDSVEEQDDARVALDGYKWKNAMWDLDQLLRSTTKYGTSISDKSKEATETERDIADQVRDAIREILTEYNLNLEN
ncbi:MAG: hypothetical protein EBT39_06155 [Sphingobacteriia bacterium]|nr:hypothetical protein [Candidatus Fonsibacter lacus]